MTAARFVLVAVPSLLLAAACFVVAPVLDLGALYVVGLALLAAVGAARWALIDDLVMAGLVVVCFVAFVVLLVVNA